MNEIIITTAIYLIAIQEGGMWGFSKSHTPSLQARPCPPLALLCALEGSCFAEMYSLTLMFLAGLRMESVYMCAVHINRWILSDWYGPNHTNVKSLLPPLLALFTLGTQSLEGCPRGHAALGLKSGPHFCVGPFLFPFPLGWKVYGKLPTDFSIAITEQQRVPIQQR